VEVTLSLWIP